MDSVNKPSVVLIDDDVSLLLLVKDILEAHNYGVSEFETATDALEYISIRGKSIDLVISDISMPDMSGYDLCKKMNKQRDLKSIPVLLISSTIGVDAIVEGYNSGCFDFIPKPVVSEELLAKVKNAFKIRSDFYRFEEKLKKTKSIAYDAMASGSKLSEIVSLSEHDEHIKNFDDLSQQVFLVLQNHDIKAALLFKGKHADHYYTMGSSGNPLELEMIRVVRDSKSFTKDNRFFEFKGRVFVKYNYAIILIKNYSALNGDSWKDFICALMNFVDNRARILVHEETRKEEIKLERQEIICKFEESISEIKGIFSSQMQSLNGIVDLIMSELSVSFASLDIGEHNEETICKTVRAAFDQLESSIERGDKVFSRTVDDLLIDLNNLLFK